MPQAGREAAAAAALSLRWVVFRPPMAAVAAEEIMTTDYLADQAAALDSITLPTGRAVQVHQDKATLAVIRLVTEAAQAVAVKVPLVPTALAKLGMAVMEVNGLLVLAPTTLAAEAEAGG